MAADERQVAESVVAMRALERLQKELVRVARGINIKESTYAQGWADGLFHAAEQAQTMMHDLGACDER
jgi:hypothetical protein